MPIEWFDHRTFNKIRAFVYTPVGLTLAGMEVNKLMDKETGNGSFFYLALGLYLVGRGVTGAMNLYQQKKSDLENKVDE